VIVGLRPEDFEDAELLGDKSRGITFKAKIDVLESMGSEFYAYFNLESEKVSSRELEELAHDAGAADLPTKEGSQVVARLEAASKVRQGQETELWFNTEHLHLFDPRAARACWERAATAMDRRRRPQPRTPPRPRETRRQTANLGADAQPAALDRYAKRRRAA